MPTEVAVKHDDNYSPNGRPLFDHKKNTARAKEEPALKDVHH